MVELFLSVDWLRLLGGVLGVVLFPITIFTVFGGLVGWSASEGMHTVGMAPCLVG